MKPTNTWPLAYFLTFTTYGTHLIGHRSGSVDKNHNQFGTPFVPPNQRRESRVRERMGESAYFLGRESRALVLKAILRACRRYGWDAWAIHVRTNHAHGVVTADTPPEVVLQAWKSFATRALNENGLDPTRKRRWTLRGSKRYLWTEEQLWEAIDYVVNRQGDAMEVWVKEW